jgi:monoamine oxidase
MAIATDVAVLGAGLAGLRTAWLLQGKGLSVVLVEARDRVGGRAHTVRVPVVAGTEALTATVDVGGQWVGPQQPLCLDLCRLFGIELEEQLWPGGDADGKVAMAAAAGLSGAPTSPDDALDMERVEGLLRELSKQVHGHVVVLVAAADWGYVSFAT